MNAMVVYESVYGNTRVVAEAIADALGAVSAVPVHEAPTKLEGVELLVVGGPTHMHGLTTSRSRRLASEAGAEDGQPVERGAAERPGLREWLRDLPDGEHVCAAAFDTRLDRSPALTGVAAHGIARRLRRHGYTLLASVSFLVEDAQGPLEAGELDRARAWGVQLAQQVPSSDGVHAATEVSPS